MHSYSDEWDMAISILLREKKWVVDSGKLMFRGGENKESLLKILPVHTWNLSYSNRMPYQLSWTIQHHKLK